MSEITGKITMPFHGKSAYEIACKYGYEGTEEEWVESLGFIPEGSIGLEKLKDDVVEVLNKKEEKDNKGKECGYVPLNEESKIEEKYFEKLPVNITVNKTGECIEITDGADAVFGKLSLYGKSVQDKEADIQSPAEIEGVGGEVAIVVSGNAEEERCSTDIGCVLHGIKVTEGGNYTDESGQSWVCDELDLRNGIYIKRVHEQVFDGSEAWQEMSAIVGKRYRCKPSLAVLRSDTAKVNSMNSSFKLGENGGTAKTPECYTIADQVYCVLSGEESLDEFKAYLKEKPMKILAVLQTPVESEISLENVEKFRKMHGFYKNTLVTNSKDAKMNVDYTADTKLYIDNKFEELSRAIINN